MGGLLRHSTKAPSAGTLNGVTNPAGRILYLRSGPTQAITEVGDDAWCAPGTKVTRPRNYTLLRPGKAALVSLESRPSSA